MSADPLLDPAALPRRASAVFFGSPDPARLARFHADLWQAGDPNAEPDGVIGFQTDGVYFGYQQSPKIVTVWIDVADVQAAYERAIALGARPHHPPSRQGKETLASVLDPDGNPLGFVGPVPSS